MNNIEPTVASLRLVQKIVQTGQLTAAASQLHLSQSAASHALKVLESQVGTALFVRERGGLRLSEAGHRLFPHIESVLTSLEAIRSEAAGLTKLEAGTLRIAAVPSLLASILPPILREYTVRFPGIAVAVFEGTDDEVRLWVVSGMAHVGFAALPVDDVMEEEIAQDEWLALVPEDKFPGRSAVALRELIEHPFLMCGGGCEHHIQRIFLAAGSTINKPLLVKQIPTIRAMVAANLGVALIPSSSSGDLRGSRTLVLKPRLFRRIGMLRSTAIAPTPALDAWMALTKATIRHETGERKKRKHSRNE